MAEFRTIASAMNEQDVAGLQEVRLRLRFRFILVVFPSHVITPWSLYELQIRPQINVDHEEFRKVFERPFAAPLPSESAPQNTQVKTSHYDYNFDEKDYKSES